LKIIRVDLTRTEQFWIFWAFFLAYAIKIPLIPFILGKPKCTKSACCWNDAFVRDYVKDGLYSVIRWQLPIAPLAKTYLPILLGLVLLE
jgi:NADH-quinone oxidoreductase subunit M